MRWADDWIEEPHWKDDPTLHRRREHCLAVSRRSFDLSPSCSRCFKCAPQCHFSFLSQFFNFFSGRSLNVLTRLILRHPFAGRRWRCPTLPLSSRRPGLPMRSIVFAASPFLSSVLKHNSLCCRQSLFMLFPTQPSLSQRVSGGQSVSLSLFPPSTSLASALILPPIPNCWRSLFVGPTSPLCTLSEMMLTREPLSPVFNGRSVCLPLISLVMGSISLDRRTWIFLEEIFCGKRAAVCGLESAHRSQGTQRWNLTSLAFRCPPYFRGSCDSVVSEESNTNSDCAPLSSCANGTLQCHAHARVCVRLHSCLSLTWSLCMSTILL